MMLLVRRLLAVLAVSLAASLPFVPASVARAGEALDAAKAERDDTGTLWYDIRLLGVEGQGWTDTKAPFDRLPGKAEGSVRKAVWDLSRHSAGLCVRFTTDSPSLQVRWKVTSERLAMPHMPATAVSGLDLYVRAPEAAAGWRWLAVAQPRAYPENKQALVSNLPPEQRDYLLYLPLYNGVSSVELGLPASSKLAKAEPRQAARRKPIIFYGTSITQGGCASRAGMVHTAILGRRLDYPVINLGFSGNGKMEPEVVRLLAEIDAAVYVIDCLPNMQAKEVTERTEPLVRLLRQARPKTPILLVEDRNYADAFLVAARRERNETNQRALKAVYEKLVSAGVENLHYLPGDDLIGDDGEGTVDGSHPTDLGFMRQADAFEKVLRPLLESQSAE